jgi:uncharacterized membrane-anchored protein YjiN (DUF445 family)
MEELYKKVKIQNEKVKEFLLGKLKEWQEMENPDFTYSFPVTEYTYSQIQLAMDEIIDEYSNSKFKLDYDYDCDSALYTFKMKILKPNTKKRIWDYLKKEWLDLEIPRKQIFIQQSILQKLLNENVDFLYEALEELCTENSLKFRRTMDNYQEETTFAFEFLTN